MSLTLGEKLRQAREERGIPISEVAEQTRISPLYLQSIENDDYKILPGGIFNKGFIKSYAKYVGIDEQEALLDYAKLLARDEAVKSDDPPTYKPEVLTDDRSGSSMTPTIILAVVILAAMSAAVLFGVNYIRSRPETAANTNPDANSTSNSNTGSDKAPVSSGATPEMSSLKVEFKALDSKITLSTVVDGIPSKKEVKLGSPITLEPKETLVVNYLRWNAKILQMTINGKEIALPAEPENPKDQRIEFTISKETLPKIWEKASISGEAPPPPVDANANAAVPPTTGNAPITTPKPVTATPKPSVPANTANAATPAPKPSATVKSNPTPKSTVISIPPVNRN